MKNTDTKPTNRTHKNRERPVAVQYRILILSLLIFGAGFLIGALVFYTKGKNVALAKSATLQTYEKGSLIATSHFDFKVNSVTYDDKGGRAFKPSNGYKFVVLSVYIKNKTNGTMPVFPSNQTQLKDDQGKVYRMSVAELSDPFQAGNLPPGDQIQGQIAFEVPEGLQNPTFFFDSGWPDSNVAIRI